MNALKVHEIVKLENEILKIQITMKKRKVMMSSEEDKLKMVIIRNNGKINTLKSEIKERK